MINRPNQVWSSDITYCRLPGGFVYLVAIVEWSISNTAQPAFIVKTVEEAIKVHGKPEIINSAQGSPFTSRAYIDAIKSQETIRISMDAKGRATDNIMIERFFRSYKYERLYLEGSESVSDLKRMTLSYIERYNDE